MGVTEPPSSRKSPSSEESSSPTGVARLMVTALDLYNVRRTDGVGQSWDEEAEQLFQELQTLFAKTYGEGLYAA